MAQTILNASSFQILIQVRYFHFPYRIFSKLHYTAQRRVFVRQKLHPQFTSSIRFLVQKKTLDELCCGRWNELETARHIFSQQGKLDLLKANEGQIKNNLYNMERKVRRVF